MSNAQLLVSGSTAQTLAQKLGVILTKAALSSIPLTGLVFDIGQLAVDLANQRVAEKFLRDLAGRVDCLSEDVKRAMRSDTVYEAAAYATLRTLAFETSETVAVVLARAVAQLGEMSEASTYKAQCARAIAEFNEPVLHALQTNDRFHKNLLMDEERFICSKFQASTEQMAALLNATLSVPNWDSIMRRIMDIGLLEQHFDGGRIGDDAPPMVQTAPTSPYGQVVMGLCFDDVGTPLFGRFANMGEMNRSNSDSAT